MSDVFTPDKRDQGTRRELAAGRSVLAVFAGLHGHAQGLTQVLQAAERLRDLDGVGFVFVGDGPEKEALIAQSAEFQLDNVFFHDPVPLSEVPSILASSDLAIVPLVGHILGQVPAKIYEAMGAGIPVLLVAAGEAATIVTQCGAGVVVAPGDIDGIVAAVRGLAGDAMARDTMGRAGRRAAVEQYDRYKIVDGLAEVLEESL
jgi:glycosyltransferase involved in cell wall biosynthesis